MKLEMYNVKSNGKLITFCGLDGCGKSTQISHVYNWLSSMGYDIFLTKQPTDLIRNSSIFRTYMDEEYKSNYNYQTLSLLCAADRLQHTTDTIIKKLNEGKIVISDRYFYSCIVNLHARGYESDLWIYDISKHIPNPDISFFLDISVEKAIERVRTRADEKDRYIDIDLQYKLRENYIKIANENNGVIISTEVDEKSSFKKIQDTIKKILILEEI